jgi:hypothetical protein
MVPVPLGATFVCCLPVDPAPYSAHYFVYIYARFCCSLHRPECNCWSDEICVLHRDPISDTACQIWRRTEGRGIANKDILSNADVKGEESGGRGRRIRRPFHLDCEILRRRFLKRAIMARSPQRQRAFVNSSNNEWTTL